jgi:hypothetical protein
MKKNKKIRFWLIVFAVSGMLIALFISQINKVSAAFDDIHAVYVLLRVEKEIMQKSPAGQYYESLFWKHNDELMKISASYPENNQEFWRVTRMYIPGLEALLDGDGDSIRITEEQVQGLKTELDQIASMGSSVLREDIEKEQERLPLENFIGMTMTEALDYINSTWTPDASVEKAFVPDSNGEWAYYILDTVYIEYPGSWYIQKPGVEENMIYFLPSLESPEEWSTGIMKLRVLNLPVEIKDQYNRSVSYAQDVQWQNHILLPDFQGDEFVLGDPNAPVMLLDSFLYNEERQVAVELWLMFKESETAESAGYPEAINQKYGYYQHMVESIRIENP